MTTRDSLVGQIRRPGQKPENVELIVNRRPVLTAAEKAAGLKWVDGRYPPGDIRRYGGGESQTAAINDAAIAKAISANMEVTLPRVTDGVYDISAQVALTEHGQVLQGRGVGDVSGPGTDGGVTLNVASGFPTTGGDEAQSAVKTTGRYQVIRNIQIDCNGIAKHGLYGDSNTAFCRFEDILISAPDGDGVFHSGSSWMNTFDKVRISIPDSGWGFNFDNTAGGNNTTTTLIQCYVSDAAALNGTALGGYRFDRSLSFTLISCAADNLVSGPALSVEDGATVHASEFHTERTRRIADVDGSTSSLVINGGTLNQYGSDSVTVADIFNIEGKLSVVGVRFENGEAATLFMDLASTARVFWQTNTIRLFDEEIGIIGATGIFADQTIRPSSATTGENRLEVRSSAPSFTLFETGNADENFEWRLEDGALSLRELDDDYNVVGTAISYQPDNNVWRMFGVQEFVDDAAAATGGIPVNGIYRTGSALKIRVS